MKTVDQAIWEIDVYRDVGATPIGNPLIEGARFNRLRSMLLWEMEACQWRDLFARLGGTFTKTEMNIHAGEPPVLLPLLRLIDRRERLGIPSPEETATQRLRGMFRRKAG